MNRFKRRQSTLAAVIALSVCGVTSAKTHPGITSTDLHQTAYFHIKTGARHFPQTNTTANMGTASNSENKTPVSCAYYKAKSKQISVYKNRYCQTMSQTAYEASAQQIAIHF